MARRAPLPLGGRTLVLGNDTLHSSGGGVECRVSGSSDAPTPAACRYRYWKRAVPRIPDDILDSVIYLYPTREDAEAGEPIGGSGFLVVIPYEDPSQGTGLWDGSLPGDRYAVTNQHVAFGESDAHVIRLNTQDGQTHILETDPGDWHRHPDGDDLAVCPLELDPGLLKIAAIPTYTFIREDYSADEYGSPGPGDEVFFVGRFVTHEGKQTNRPTARFGNISMYPAEPVPSPTGITQESFLVEARSLSGYSGSPVIVYNIAGGIATPYKGLLDRPRQALLGVDWCHLRNRQPVLEKDLKTETGQFVLDNTGLMGVVPAWKILDLLAIDDLREMREKGREARHKTLDSSPESV